MNRELTDTGIDYIKYLPASWDTIRIKNIVDVPVVTGAGEEAKDYSENSIRYIRISDFDKDGNIDNSKAAYIPCEKGNKFLIKKGDILAATAGGTVGKTLLFNGLNEDACYAGYLARIRTDSKRMNNKFLLYQMRCKLMDDFRTCAVKKSTIENISASTYSNMRVACPPIEEQDIIVRYLDKKCASIDKVVSKTKDTIDEYKKFRQSIITEAITKGICEKRTVKSTKSTWFQAIPSDWKIEKLKYVSMSLCFTR